MQRITLSNHDQYITPAVVASFPADMKEAHDFYQEFSELRNEDASIAEAIDLYLENAGQFVNNTNGKDKTEDKAAKVKRPPAGPAAAAGPTAKKKTTARRASSPKSAARRTASKSKPKAKAKSKPKTQTQASSKPKPKTRRTAKISAKKKTEPEARRSANSTSARRRAAGPTAPVSSLSAEVKVARRAKNMHGKALEAKTVGNFVKYLQKLILDKQIRKTSEHADTIQDLQRLAINFHNTMQGSEKFNIPDALYKKVEALAQEEKVRDSVRLLASFVRLIGSNDKEKFTRLVARMEKAIKSGKVNSRDPYYKQYKKALDTLKTTSSELNYLTATETELSGLRDVLNEFGIQAKPTKAGYNVNLKVPPVIKKAVNSLGKKSLNLPDRQAGGSADCALAGIDQEEMLQMKINAEMAIAETNPPVARPAAAAGPGSPFDSPVSGGQQSAARHPVSGGPVVRHPAPGFQSISSIKPVADTFRLLGPIGELMGNLERYMLAVTLEGDQGAGKSRFAMQLANAFAELGMRIGYFSLEMGARSNLILQLRDEYIAERNQPYVQITGEAPEGINSVRQAARQFDVIVLDSWTSLHESTVEFDRLRKEFPDTIFIVLFQRASSGLIRGGTRPLYDAGINLEAVKKDGNFKNNYVVAAKNRYGMIGPRYNIYSQQIIEETSPAE